jgi:S-adenosylmethionine hydrolase
MMARGAKLQLGSMRVKSFRSYFAEDTGSQDKVFGIWGSAGFLEIAAANDSAASLLNAKRGDPVVVGER